MVIEIGLALAVLIVLGFVFRKRLTATFSKVAQGSGKGSAFVKVAEADARSLELKGKVIALKAANSAAHGTASELEKAAADVHADADAVQARLTSVESQL